MLSYSFLTWSSLYRVILLLFLILYCSYLSESIYLFFLISNYSHSFFFSCSASTALFSSSISSLSSSFCEDSSFRHLSAAINLSISYFFYSVVQRSSFSMPMFSARFFSTSRLRNKIFCIRFFRCSVYFKYMSCKASFSD